jgi:hypothetical protein
MTDIITIPLNRLALWKGNLAASIASHGRRPRRRARQIRGRRRSKAVSPSVAR